MDPKVLSQQAVNWTLNLIVIFFCLAVVGVLLHRLITGGSFLYRSALRTIRRPSCEADPTTTKSSPTSATSGRHETTSSP